MRRTASILLSAGLLSAGLWAAEPSRSLAAEPKTWDYAGGGQWPLVEPTAKADAAVDNPVLDKAEALLKDKDASAAEDLLVEWVKAHRTAPDRDRALFLLASAYYDEGDRKKAFYQLDEVLETYPESRYYYPSLEKQYDIADAYLGGYKNKLLGIRLLSGTDDAIDMLFRVQEKAPGSALAERAMLRTADYYYNTGQFDLSADVYSAFLRSYPRSPDVPRVRLRRAFSSYAQFHGTKFDATPLIEARAQMEDLKVKYPEMAQEVNVQKFIDDINTTLAQKLLVTADFYKRTGHPQAAAVTYREVMATYADTKEAQQAETALAALPESARATELPPAKAPFEVTTRPVFGPIGPTAPTPRPAGLPGPGPGPVPGEGGVGPVDRGGGIPTPGVPGNGPGVP